MSLLLLLWGQEQHQAFLIVFFISFRVLLLILAVIHLLPCDENSYPCCVGVTSRGPVLRQTVKTRPQSTVCRTPLSSPSAFGPWPMGPLQISPLISSIHLGPVLPVTSLSLVTLCWTRSSRTGRRNRWIIRVKHLEQQLAWGKQSLRGGRWLLHPSILA